MCGSSSNLGKGTTNYSAASLPVVAGIDGSKQAIRAAIWASDEAVSRDTRLLLVHVVDGNSTDLDRDYAFAEDVVHKAWKEVENTGNPSSWSPTSGRAIPSPSSSRSPARRR